MKLQACVFLATLLSALCATGGAHATEADAEDERVLIVTRARVEVQRVTRYAGEWMPTSGYPMGDVPSDRGACTDLVVRALRAVGIDLQRLVHEDIVRAPAAYGIRIADPQVDHRRANVLLTFFRRHATGLTLDVDDIDAFAPGDIVFFGPSVSTPRTHVAIVSDRAGPRGLPLVLENGGPRPVEADTLDTRSIVGHFRVAGARRSRAELASVLQALIAR